MDEVRNNRILAVFKRLLPFIFLFLASMLILVPLFQHETIYGHDTNFHLANIIGRGEGNTFDILGSKVIGFFARGFGYGTGIFYPELPHFIASIFYIIGFSPSASLKITYFLIAFCSGITMFIFLKKVLADTKSSASRASNSKEINLKKVIAALLGSIFYLTTPYFIGNFLIRGALNEAMFFVFLPLIFLGINYLIRKDYLNFLIFFTFGYIGAIYSHLVMTVYLSLFLIIIALFFLKYILQKKPIKYILASGLIILAGSLSFIVPLLENMKNEEYYVFNSDIMISAEKTNNFRIGLADLFSIGRGEDSTFLYINICAFVLAIFVVCYLIKNRHGFSERSYSFAAISAIILICISVLFTSKLINWQNMPNFLLSLQFPWRLMTLISFGLSVLSAIGIYIIFTEYMKHSLGVGVTTVVLLAICGLYAYSTFPQVVYRDRPYEKEELYTDTIYYKDYYPMKLYRAGEEYIKNRNHSVEIISGSANIEQTEPGTYLVKDVENVNLELPLIYYLGYNIRSENGNIPYEISNNGFIKVHLDSDTKLQVKYSGTLLSKISSAISFTALIIFCGWIVYHKKRRRANL